MDSTGTPYSGSDSGPAFGPASGATGFARLHAGNPARLTRFDLAARQRVLADLARAIRDRQEAVIAALAADLGKPASETRLTEILPVLAEIRHASRHLRGWMRGRRIAPTLAMLGTRARLLPQPKGTVLIIAPWNYPFSLALGPLVSALAAGNAAVVKPSELAPATSALIATLLASALPADLVAVEEGGAEVAQALLALPFDHVFFTGSAAVGRQVMEAAARHLTPVTLELGGKSPAVIGPDAPLAQAARMIAWGKCTNAGQTCIAPDHVYVPRAALAPLVALLRAEITRMARGPGGFARIVNARHHARLEALREDVQARGGDVERIEVRASTETPPPGLPPGAAQDLHCAPALITDTSPAMEVMRTEIFGPLLPLIPYDTTDEVIDALNAGERPLALYLFSKDHALHQRFARQTHSGALGINLTLVHYLHLNLPFGGIGHSGIGAAHGIWGFRTFSHEKPVLEKGIAPFHLLMPPYSGAKRGLIRWVQRLIG